MQIDFIPSHPCVRGLAEASSDHRPDRASRERSYKLGHAPIVASLADASATPSVARKIAAPGKGGPAWPTRTRPVACQSPRTVPRCSMMPARTAAIAAVMTAAMKFDTGLTYRLTPRRLRRRRDAQRRSIRLPPALLSDVPDSCSIGSLLLELRSGAGHGP